MAGRRQSGRERETAETARQVPRRRDHLVTSFASWLFHRHHVVGRMVPRLRRRKEKFNIHARFQSADHGIDLVTAKGIPPKRPI